MKKIISAFQRLLGKRQYPNMFALNIKMSDAFLKYYADYKEYVIGVKKDFELILEYKKARGEETDYYRNAVITSSSSEDVSAYGKFAFALDVDRVYEDYFVNEKGEIEEIPFDEEAYKQGFVADEIDWVF